MNADTPNAWLPRPLRRLAGRALESALNHMLRLDPEAPARLAALDGRRIELQLRGPELRLAIVVRGERLAIEPPAEHAALRVAATPGSLLRMALRGDDDGAAAPGAVEIAGDAELARRLQKLARQYAPDLEDALTRRLGDVAGMALARALGGALEQLRESASHAREDAVDWLRDEARLTPPAHEVDDFLDAVDALRERSERLAARLARLETERTGKGRAA